MKLTAGQLHDLLRIRIIAGQYHPGRHLTESSLADEFGVSRSPVRVALRRLAELRLVELVPNHGAFVTEFTISDVEEVFALRKTLESHGAQLAATRRNGEDLARLESLTSEMRQIISGADQDRVQLLHTNNEQFHEAILIAARSPRLHVITMGLASKSTTLGSYFGYSEADIERSYHGHEEIRRAIELQQGERAAALMWIHLDTARLSFIGDRFRQLSESDGTE